MKRHWRNLFAALALFTAMVMVAGCATTAPTAAPATQAPATDAPKTQEPTVEPTEPAVELPPVNLVWYLVGNGDEPDQAAVLAKVNEYLKPKINATVDLRVIGWGDYDNKVNPMLAAGEKFDLLFSCSWAGNYRLNASSGFLLEITDLLKQYAPDVEKVLGPDFLYASSVGGKQYTMPCNKEKAHAWGPLMRKDLVDKYKIDMSAIKSWKDFEPVLKIIKDNEKDVWPLLVVQGEAPFATLDWDYIGDKNIPGALYSNNDESNVKVIDQFTAPESVEHYKLMRDYFTKGYINPESPTQTDFKAELKSGKYFCVDQSLKPNKYIEMSNELGVEYVQAQFSPSVMSNGETTGSMLALPAACPNPERTMMFVNLLYTDAFVINTLNFGIEGEHYVKVSDTQIKAGPKNATTPAGYNPGHTWKFGNQYLEFLSEKDPTNMWDLYKSFNDSAIPLRSLGFIWDGANVQTEASACKNVVAKYYVNLFNGAGTESVDDTVAKFAKELKDAGVDVLLADMQKQYDAFLAAKK